MFCLYFLNLLTLYFLNNINFIYSDKGIDISSPANLEQTKCFKKNGYKSIYIRVWQSNNKFDSNSVNTIKNARAAGIDNVDCYVFPCAKCKDANPKNIIEKILKNLKAENVKCDRIWIDVEGPQYWKTNKQQNVDFIQGMVNELKANKQKIGIYTSNAQWQPITGGSTKFNDFPLWYPHYDNKANFVDFKPFGGWKKPLIKQYDDNKKVCNVNADLNFF